jgi:glycosyltransferase involved in cell wall biosynthesis
MHNPLISVVMVTHNGAAYVQEQLQTVLAQTLQNFELIILDNASDDGTYAILQNFAQQNKNIKLYHNEINTGANKGFEQAMLLASGEYIAPCDQDDVWETNKLETMISFMEEQTLFAFSRPGQFRNGNFEQRTYPASYLYRDVTDERQLIFHTPVSGHACMFKKDLLQLCLPFPADVYYDWWISINAVSVSILKYVPHTLTWQRVHGGNASLQTYKLPKKEQQQKLRMERLTLLEHYFSHNKAESAARNSLQQYLVALKRVNTSLFSKTMFMYVMNNRRWVFHYKKKSIGFLSHLKYAIRMAGGAL